MGGSGRAQRPAATAEFIIVRHMRSALELEVSIDSTVAGRRAAPSSQVSPDSLPVSAGTSSSIPARLLLLPPEGDAVLHMTVLEAQPAHDVMLQPDSILPHTFAELKVLGRWRGWRLGRLVVYPVIRDQDGRRLQARLLGIKIAFPVTTQKMTGSAQILPFEQRVLAQALNREFAAVWREFSASQKSIHRDEGAPAASGEAAKIIIREDGIYRLTYAALAQAGFPVDAYAPRNLHLTRANSPVPYFLNADADSLFEPDESLWFFGERLAGDSSWYNDETDENVYWLTAAPSPGLHFTDEQVADSAAVPFAQTFWQELHFEEDRNYYHGDTDADIFTTAPVAGEGWIWTRLLGGDTFETNLVLPNMSEPSQACSLRVRLRGITRDPARPNHHVMAYLNDVFVTEANFSNNEEKIIRTVVAPGVLHNGTNTLRLEAPGDTQAQIDQIYLDWIEVGYHRTYVAANNHLRFAAPAGQGTVRYQITNLHEREMYLFDLDRGVRLTEFRVTKLGDTQYFLNFIGRAGTASRYIVFSPAALREPERIRLRPAPEPGSRPGAADLIIITHHNFLPAAERLASYRRQSSGLRVEVVDIEEIYDAFSAGIESAAAVRAFITHAFFEWEPPAPQYVILIGDGSWDPKKNAPLSGKQSFLPVFGNPVSDNRFVCVDGPDDFLPDMAIGRLAVESAAEAEAVVDKIITYENKALQDWAKDFVFLNGGITEHEQSLFLAQSERLIDQYVLPAPVGGRPQRIYKTTPGRSAGEQKPQILAAIDSGAVMLTFSGHAGSQTWELMMVNEDIALLQNEDRFPFIASMTCHTARFGNPEQNSFGEDFLRLPGRGAVGFWGTSGWGFILQDGIMLDGFFQAVARDSVRNVGEAILHAKMHLIRQLGAYAVTRNLIDQYTLLGDPVLKLALPLQPDLALRQESLTFEPPAPLESDSLVNVRIVVRNRGLVNQDSTTLHFEAVSASDNGPAKLADLPLGRIGFSDTLVIPWYGTGRTGEYRISAIVDRDNLVSESDESNNAVLQTLHFFTTSAAIAAPLDMQVVAGAQPILQVYNPAAPPEQERFFNFELDTSATFTTDFLITSPPVAEQTLRTSWRVPRILSDGRYFWRVRTMDGPESGALGRWTGATFFVDSRLPGPAWRQQGQLWRRSTGAFAVYADGAGLPPDPGRRLLLQVQSGGFYDLSRCYLIVNGEIVNEGKRGINILAIDPVTQQPTASPRAYDTFVSRQAADSMAAFLESLPERTLLLAGIRDDGSAAMTGRAYAALEQFGSGKIRQVALRDSWGLIGMKGMAPGTAREVHKRARTGLAIVSDTLQPFLRSTVFHSPPVGPAAAWQRALWAPGAGLHLAPPDAYGISRTQVQVQAGKSNHGPWETVVQDVRREGRGLSDLHAGDYPYLRLRAVLEDDDGLDSPILHMWQVDFVPAGDLVASARHIDVPADSILPGEKIQISARLHYFGPGRKDSVKAVLQTISQQKATVTPAQVWLSLSEDEPATVVFNWAADMPGTYTLELVVDPENQIAEPYEQNNRATTRLIVRQDSTPPSVQVYFDDVLAVENSYVRRQPQIRCEIYDDSPAAIRDSSQVHFLLDGRRLAFASGEVELLLISQGSKRAELLAHPELAPGAHRVDVRINDNFGQAVRREVTVQVSERLALLQVMNYPNPFAESTNFTFVLTQEADQGRIKIYTVAGRLIRELEFLPVTGFNTIFWDGRDADGDLLANGVYLYKVIVQTGEKQTEHIAKLLISR